MVDIATLKDIRDRLVRATGPDRELDAAIGRCEGWELRQFRGDDKEYWRAPGDKWGCRSSVPSYTANLDACVALAERVLPGRSWKVAFDPEPPIDAGGCFWARMSPRLHYAATPALAFLTAIVSVLIAKAEKEAAND